MSERKSVDKIIKDILKNATQEYSLYDVLPMEEIIMGTDPEIEIYRLDWLELSEDLNDESLREYTMVEGEDKPITDAMRIEHGLYSIDSALENQSDVIFDFCQYKIIQLDGKDIYIAYSVHVINEGMGASADYDNVEFVGVFESLDAMETHYRDLGFTIRGDESDDAWIKKSEAFILENWDYGNEEEAQDEVDEFNLLREEDTNVRDEHVPEADVQTGDIVAPLEFLSEEEEDKFFKIEMLHEAYVQNMRKAQKVNKTDAETLIEENADKEEDKNSSNEIVEEIKDIEIISQPGNESDNSHVTSNRTVKECSLCGIKFDDASDSENEYCLDCQRVNDSHEKGKADPTEEEVDARLKELIKKFNEDGDYFREILQRANSSILRTDHSPLDSLAEKKLIEMVIMSRY